MNAWGVLWHSRNRLDGETRRLIWSPMFRTRRECREFIDTTFGYIRHRPDLQTEPHGWRIPRAVRVIITAKETR